MGELHDLFNDVDVRRYLLDGQLVDRAWVVREVAASETRFREGGMGIWTVRELPARDEADVGVSGIVGFVGYRPFFDPPELQLLYGFLPTSWGRGYATESAAAAIRHGFERMGLGVIRAATDAPNRASIAVLERLGFERVECGTGAPDGTICFVLRRPA